MTRILILLLFIFAGLVVPSFAQEVPTPVRAKLVADIAAVKPGESFNLGVLMGRQICPDNRVPAA